MYNIWISSYMHNLYWMYQVLKRTWKMLAVKGWGTDLQQKGLSMHLCQQVATPLRGP